MAALGNIVIWIIMISALLGAIASLRNSEQGMGKEFLEGLHSIGPIFVPVAGIMASIPFLSKGIEVVFGPLFETIGADSAIAATTLIAVDMGGYQLAEKLAQSTETWIMAMVTGYMAGATIVFSIPVGLTLLKKEDHQYMALGTMAGVLSIPIGVFISCAIMALSHTLIRPSVSTELGSTYVLSLSFGKILVNLLPLILFCSAIALGLRFVPRFMVRLFLFFGKIMTTGVRLVLVLSVIEYFTKVFSTYIGWGFDPIIADSKDTFRALEISGYIGVMLCGAFPMVYLLQKYLSKPIQFLGRKIGLEETGAAGILAAAANILALFHLIEKMRPKDKVLCIAFAVCSAFMFGDHLAFTANFQPNLILPILLGKLAGGVSGFVLASWLSVPLTRGLAQPKASLVVASV